MQALQQSDVFAEGLARIGAPVARRGADGIVVLRRFGFGFASRVCGAAGDLPALVNAEREEDATVLRQRGYRQILTAAYVAELDLTPPVPALQAGLTPSWRRALAKASAPGLERRRFDLDRHRWVLEWEARQRSDRQYRAWPLALTAAMAGAVPGAVQVWSSRQDAAVVFVRHGEAASYHIGWTGPEARRRDTHRQLLWKAAIDLKGEGVRLLDLGHVDSISSPGLAAYKAGTGARVRPLGGTWLYLPGLGIKARSCSVESTDPQHQPWEFDESPRSGEVCSDIMPPRSR